jgi:phage terminase small subunit
MGKLTEKQKRFCNEYLIDLNATQAAIRSGYSYITAKEIGYENLTKPHIKTYIEKRITERAERTNITQDMVVEELAKIAFSKIDDYVEVDDSTGSNNVIVKATRDVQEERISAVSSIKQGSNGIEIKLHDKVRALENLGRHLGMFKDKIEIFGTNEIHVKIED